MGQQEQVGVKVQLTSWMRCVDDWKTGRVRAGL
jgi:hypothetical protein